MKAAIIEWPLSLKLSSEAIELGACVYKAHMQARQRAAESQGLPFHAEPWDALPKQIQTNYQIHAADVLHDVERESTR